MPTSPGNEVTIGLGELRFSWHDWDRMPLGGEAEWAHPGLTVLPDGDIAVFDQGTHELVRLGSDGTIGSRRDLAAACAHGLTAASDGSIWVADTGVTVRVVDGEVRQQEVPGQVLRLSPDGSVTTLARPQHALYADGPYLPTSIAVADTALGGNGDVWVADGYGQALVHRYSSSGEQLLTLDGEEGGGRFKRAHAVTIDRRGDQPRLLVTDRSNHRVAVYDLDGTFIKLLGVGELRMPSAFAVAGDLLYVAELWSRMAVYDPEDQLIGYLGDGEEAWEEVAWPNLQQGDRVERRPVHPGRFNAPHGLDAGADGTLYIAEWTLGGRIVELAPVAR
jgi:hypothetical protein